MPVKKWVLTVVRDGEKTKTKVEEKMVVMDQTHAVVLSRGGSTGTVVKKERVFDDAKSARIAAARGGKPCWVFVVTREHVRGLSDKPERPEVFYAYVYPAPFGGWTVQRVNEKKEPLGRPITVYHISRHTRESAALKEMARWVAMTRPELRKSRKLLELEEKYMDEVVRSLRRKKVKIPKPEKTKGVRWRPRARRTR